MSDTAHSQEVVLAGVLGGKALLVVDGGPPRTLAVGQRLGAVQLVSVSADAAEIDISGQRSRLTLGGQPVSAASRASSAREVTLVSDLRGHFSTIGTINGSSVRFLVDTGASLVSMGPATAVAAGIDYRRGEQGMASTANGVVPVWRVRIRKLTLGDIQLEDVDSVVMQVEMPAVLLGMSVLNRMEMRRDGSTMVLRQRY
ncbi:TIGR02281 family clan AA aspartic protease [Uliginosibacterium paludis]|uniref:TIGR02281 family clan AA aspartic protease n=1 Tax=Uliginosibacterium paludis TaxID=1615952 RepID=A0ABV2CKD4_9RHOO